MASIQDIANAAYRIKESTTVVEHRAVACADSLRTHSARLAGSVKGSRTGEGAVQQVNQAERAVRESAVRLSALRSEIDQFVQDLTK
ncbi:MAG: hypothetical protein LBD77_03575 [Bifidobacteriaceae bacterium]|jgi:hypothetical protein|nr:hypothetical protein [Bifidobacteriaceae bacterium]